MAWRSGVRLGGGAGVLSKKSMNAPKGEHMDAGNTFAVLTTLAFLAVLPVALAVEGPAMAAAWAKALEGPYSQNELITRIVVSGPSPCWKQGPHVPDRSPKRPVRPALPDLRSSPGRCSSPGWPAGGRIGIASWACAFPT